MTTPEAKVCAYCGAMFLPRKGEGRHLFGTRKTCGRECGNALGAVSNRTLVAARRIARHQQIRQYLLEHPGVTNRQVALALRAHKDTVSRVRADLWPPQERTAAKPAPRARATSHPALVPRWDITARRVAEYLQAGERARRLFDPAIAEAAMRAGVAG